VGTRLTIPNLFLLGVLDPNSCPTSFPLAVCSNGSPYRCVFPSASIENTIHILSLIIEYIAVIYRLLLWKAHVLTHSKTLSMEDPDDKVTFGKVLNTVWDNVSKAARAAEKKLNEESDAVNHARYLNSMAIAEQMGHDVEAADNDKYHESDVEGSDTMFDPTAEAGASFGEVSLNMQMRPSDLEWLLCVENDLEEDGADADPAGIAEDVGVPQSVPDVPIWEEALRIVFEPKRMSVGNGGCIALPVPTKLVAAGGASAATAARRVTILACGVDPAGVGFTSVFPSLNVSLVRNVPSSNPPRNVMLGSRCLLRPLVECGWYHGNDSFDEAPLKPSALKETRTQSSIHTAAQAELPFPGQVISADMIAPVCLPLEHILCTVSPSLDTALATPPEDYPVAVAHTTAAPTEAMATGKSEVDSNNGHEAPVQQQQRSEFATICRTPVTLAALLYYALQVPGNGTKVFNIAENHDNVSYRMPTDFNEQVRNRLSWQFFASEWNDYALQFQRTDRSSAGNESMWDDLDDDFTVAFDLIVRYAIH